MSAKLARIRILGIIAVFCVGTVLAGCSRYTGDAGADRTQQQSEELQDRIRTTQIDR